MTDASSRRASGEHEAGVDRLAPLVRHSPVGHLITDATGRIQVVNPAFAELLGYDEGDLVGLDVEEISHPDDREATRARISSLVDGVVERYTIDKRYVGRDGTVVHATVGVSAHVDPESGELRLVGAVLDRTEVVRSRAAAESAQRRYAALVEHSADIVLIIDADLRVAYASPAASRILGTNPYASPSGVLQAIHPDDREEALRRINAVLAGADQRRPIRLRALHADGSTRVLEAIGTNRIDDPDVAGIVVNARDITERVVAEIELERHRLHDELTGLPNRMLFEQRLERAVGTRSGAAAVLFLDLDRFRLVNDSFGHQVGDAILGQVAQRLQRAVRAEDTVARWSADHFAVVCVDLDPVEVQALAERLGLLVRAPYQVGDVEVGLSASVGVAFTDDDASAVDVVDEAGALVRGADAALAAAKQEGGDRWRLATADHEREARAVLTLESNLRRAVAAGELVVHYQPVVDPETSRIVGAEALVRWERPGHGLVPPAAFIPQAERSGLIVEIDEQVLRTACSDLAAWRRDLDPSLRVAVNIAARHLADPGLAVLVEAALAAAGLQGPVLTLEITETALVDDGPAVLGALDRLRRLGVKLAVDDFGTGFSSLTLLKRLPLDVLKIDQSFVSGLLTDLDDAAIVGATISLARSLGLDVVAEGVESGAQATRLAALGCRQAQGYHWSPAVPGPRFAELVARAGTTGSPLPSRHR